MTKVTLTGTRPADRAVCLSSPDCVKVLDTAGRVVSFNEDGLRLMEIDDFSDVAGRYGWTSGPRKPAARRK